MCGDHAAFEVYLDSVIRVHDFAAFKIQIPSVASFSVSLLSQETLKVFCIFAP